MAFDYTHQTHTQLMKNLEKKIKEVLEGTEGNRELRVSDFEFPPTPTSDDTRAQKNAKIQGISYQAPVYAKLDLIEDGKVISSKRTRLFDLPLITLRGTYIIDGNEFQVPFQKRLIPGAYTRNHDDGTISTWLNSSQGVNITITLREGGDFIMSIQNSGTINVYAFLIGMGVAEDKIKKVWGDEVLQTNKSARLAGKPLEVLKDVYGKLKHASDPPVDSDSIEGYRKWISNYFQNKSSYDGDNVELTLGKAFDKTSPEMILESTRKILSVSREEDKEDNKESLIHNAFFDLSDFVIERMSLGEDKNRITRVIRDGLRKKTNTTVSQIYKPDIFEIPIKSTFVQTSLGQMPKQNNPMDTAASFSSITVMGEGGIQSSHAVTRDVRAVDPTHLGFIDPVHTPEGSNIGTTLHMAKGVTKKGRQIFTKVYNAKTGAREDIDPRKFYRSYVGFPEYWEGDPTQKDLKIKLKPGSDGLIKVIHRGDFDRVKPEKVDYVMRVGTDMFGVNTIAVPFLSHNNGVRVMTASKMQSQAKPLKYREVPLIQSAVSERQPDMTIEDVVGVNSLPRAPEEGVVVSVEKDLIKIKDKEGKVHDVGVAHNMWLNENNFDHVTPNVKPGDKVKKGQHLGDSNFTKDGTLALGINMRTAYIPYKGYNHEDGVVISETGAKKLTSEHAYQKSISLQDDEEMDKDKFLSYFPAVFDHEQLGKIGDNGVVREGQTVMQGDPLILKMKEVDEDTTSKKLRNISRLLSQDYRNTSPTWEKVTPGIVEEVHFRKKDILIVIKTEEKAKIGDKIVGRYGNKGTITTILPDNEMPKDDKGNPMELLLDPSGVPGRMNAGQLIETTASKIVEKTGKKYIAKPFGGNHVESVLDDLKKHKLKDHGTLYDKDGPIQGVLYGKQYILKLEQQVEKKLSARAAGPGYSYSMSGQPSQGGGQSGRAVGLGELYALISHGADANLREMYTFKGDKQLEAWRAIENGTFLPPPQVPASSARFVAMLRGMGVNLEEENNVVKMVPFLDRDVKKITNGEILEATALRAKDLKSEDGGLFDFETTGGIAGEKWSHVKLAEPIPHPTFEKAILSVLDLKTKEFNDLVGGKVGYKNGEIVPIDTKGAITGGPAIKHMLSLVKVDKEIEELKELAPKKKGSDLNKIHKKLRILKNFKDNGIKLEEMVVDYLPIMPPKFRPIVEMPNGDISVSDVNEHYRNTIIVNNQLKEMKGRAGLIDEANKSRSNLYESLKGVAGFSMGLVDKPDIKGISATIAGTNPKSGYFHSKLIKRRQDLSGTAVVGPNPKLNMDQISIPENMAWEVFKPFIVRDLKSSGLTTISARKNIEDRSVMAREALLRVMSQKKVIANRAPTLHRWGMMAFEATLGSDNAVGLPVEVLGGFNADFDGDSCWGRVFIKLSRENCDNVDGLTQGDYMPVNHIDLKDFPRTALISSEGNVDVYSVPEGTEIYAYDRENHTVRMFPVEQYSVHKDLSMRRVKFKSKREVEVSDDHSLFCVNPDTLEFDRFKPDDSLGLMSPRPRHLITPGGMTTVAWENPGKGKRLEKPMKLNELCGYFWGAMVGDGYASKDKRCNYGYSIGFCNTDENVRDSVTEFMTLHGASEPSLHDNPHTFDGHECFSQKIHWAFGNMGHNIVRYIGSGAYNKHLPDFWQYAPREFRLGLFAGLIDTDGSLHFANGRQYQCNYTTTSPVLADEVGLLCASLGIRFTKTAYQKDGNSNDKFIISISSPDMKQYAPELNFRHEKKSEVWRQMLEFDFGIVKDPIPMPRELAKLARKNIDHKIEKSLYTIVSKTTKDGVITRQSAQRLIDDGYLNDIEHCSLHTFLAIVAADNILWDEIVEVEDLGDGHEAYDMYVPGSLVFMLSNTSIVYDTFGIHVPATEEAQQEATRMLASNNLYVTGRNRSKLAVSLGKEYMMGIYKVSKEGKRKLSKVYRLPADALAAWETGDIKIDDVILVTPLGMTTVGRIMLMNKAPEDVRVYDKTFTEKEQEKFFISVEQKHGKDALKSVMDSWKHIGRSYIYKSGTSFILSDLRTFKDLKDKLYRDADLRAAKIRQDNKLTKSQKDKKLIEIYSEVDKGIVENSSKLGVNSTGISNNIRDMVDSGMSKPGINQLKQMVGSVGLMLDHRQNVIPEPVRGNYAEGLDSSEFFQHMYAQRKGMIDKSQSVSGPGMLSKEITNSATTQKITTLDCHTKNGKMLKIDRHILDRVLSDTVGDVLAGSVIDDEVLSKLQKSGRQTVKVRSVLTCEAPVGICAKCFGIDEHGGFPNIGANVGVSEVQAITERSVQLPMKSFHTGGVATADKGLANAFDRAMQILRMPNNIRGKATLAEISGVVTEIRKSEYGGFVVTINQKQHRVPQGLELKVKQGDMVKKGQPISGGIVKPQELLKLKGVEALQDQMVQDLDDAFLSAGIKFNRRTYEPTVKMLTEQVRLTDSGDHPSLVTGDYSTMAVVDGWNKQNPGKKQIKYTNILPGTLYAPMHTEDWARRMALNRIQKTLEDGAALGFKTDRKGPSPFGDLVLGPGTKLPKPGEE